MILRKTLTCSVILITISLSYLTNGANIRNMSKQNETATNVSTKAVETKGKVISATVPTGKSVQTAKTTVKPKKTTAKPVKTTAKPVKTTAKPVKTTAKPVKTTAKPHKTTGKPAKTTAKPVKTTVKPITTTVKPESTTVKPESTTVKSSKDLDMALDDQDEEAEEELDVNVGRPGELAPNGWLKLSGAVHIPLEEEVEIKSEANYQDIINTSLNEIDVNELVEEDEEEDTEGKAGIGDENKRWKSYQMKFMFDPLMPAGKKEKIEAGLSTLSEAMDGCFKFIKVPSNNPTPKGEDFVYIKWSNTTTACHAGMGRWHGKNAMEITNACYLLYGTSMHEVMHLLGFYHEHVRPDRDEYITIDWEKLKKEKKSTKPYEIRPNQKIFAKDYDFDSIMHYASGIVKNKVPLPASVKKMGQRNYLSDGDKARLKAMYPCSEAPTGEM